MIIKRPEISKEAFRVLAATSQTQVGATAPVRPARTVEAAKLEPVDTVAHKYDIEKEISARVTAELDRQLAKLRESQELERQNVLEAARAEGVRLGLNAAENHLAKMQERLESVLLGVMEAQRPYFKDLEAAAVILAVEAASRIIGEGVVNHTLFEPWIRAGLDELSDCDHVRLHLAPEDASWALDQGLVFGNVRVITDKKLLPGEAELRSDQGSIDLGLAHQIRGLVDALAPLRDRVE